jgi:tRNA (guanine37-N1)-methyltransferase
VRSEKSAPPPSAPAVKIDVATLFPGMFREVLGTSILRLARERGAVDFGLYDIRDFTFDRHRTVDDRPYGGGPGMLLMPEPVVLCVERILRERGPGRVVLLTPQGRQFDQPLAREFAREDHLVFVCGRYEGFDERIREILSAEELSIGDYVLTGGELAAMVVSDAVVRLLPGVLGDHTSAQAESFSDGLTLEGPQYTRPPEFRGRAAPEVLLSGDHAKIARWRAEESRKKTLRIETEKFENEKSRRG